MILEDQIHNHKTEKKTWHYNELCFLPLTLKNVCFVSYKYKINEYQTFLGTFADLFLLLNWFFIHTNLKIKEQKWNRKNIMRQKLPICAVVATITQPFNRHTHVLLSLQTAELILSTISVKVVPEVTIILIIPICNAT